MSIPTIGFFSNRAGVGTTSLTYHLSWMLSELGISVLTIDFDPQATLTTLFMNERQSDQFYGERWNGPAMQKGDANTIYQAMEPLTANDLLREPGSSFLAARMSLIPGDVALSLLEEPLAAEWFELQKARTSASADQAQLSAAFWQAAQWRARSISADLVLMDIGPRLDAIARAALIASDFLIIPLAADPLSLLSLEVLGAVIDRWRRVWVDWRCELVSSHDRLPSGEMKPLGYVASPTLSLRRQGLPGRDWLKQMHVGYHRFILGEEIADTVPGSDSECLALLPPYTSLSLMGREAHKPIFSLTPAEGAIGAHAQAVSNAYRDFRKLAEAILLRVGDRHLISAAGLTERDALINLETAP